MKLQCQQTVEKQGCYIAGYSPQNGTVVRRNRGLCCIPARENGYCWRHQDIGKATIAAQKRIARYGLTETVSKEKK